MLSESKIEKLLIILKHIPVNNHPQKGFASVPTASHSALVNSFFLKFSSKLSTDAVKPKINNNYPNLSAHLLKQVN